VNHKKILLTGASGFVGRQLCQRLASTNHHVIQIIGPRAKVSSSIPSKGHPVKTYQLDLTESESIKTIFSEKFSWAIHLAAALPTSFYSEDALKAKKINQKMDRNIFKACKDNGMGVIFASSSSVYGNPDGTIKTESSPVSPLGSYSEGKWESEQYGEQILEKEAQLPFVRLRISSPYGVNLNPRGVMGLFVNRANKNQPLEFHGKGTR